MSFFAGMMRHIGNLPLNQVPLLGTHDAGCSNPSPGSRTQTKSIAEQLRYGARYFDIRIKKKGDSYTVVHNPDFPYDGVDFLNVLHDIRTFLSLELQEIVILDLMVFDPDVAKRKEVSDLLRSHFGALLTSGRNLLAIDTVQAFVDAGRRILVASNDLLDEVSLLEADLDSSRRPVVGTKEVWAWKRTTRALPLDWNLGPHEQLASYYVNPDGYSFDVALACAEAAKGNGDHKRWFIHVNQAIANALNSDKVTAGTMINVTLAHDLFRLPREGINVVCVDNLAGPTMEEVFRSIARGRTMIELGSRGEEGWPFNEDEDSRVNYIALSGKDRVEGIRIGWSIGRQSNWHGSSVDAKELWLDPDDSIVKMIATGPLDYVGFLTQKGKYVEAGRRLPHTATAEVTCIPCGISGRAIGERLVSLSIFADFTT